METGKLGFVTAPVYRSSATGQILRKMDIQTPLTAVYIQTVSALTPQPYPQPQPPAAPQGSATLHLAVPPHCSKDTFPFLTFQIAGGLQSQQPGLNLTSTIPVVKHKSAGKHVCPHCGRDCMKPSVLEKHLRCHTGERPYPCTTCRVSFKTQSNLYKHKRTQVHARLSSESEQSSLGSQDSLYSSSLSLESCSEEPGSQERDITETSGPSNIVQDCSVKTPVPDTGWAPVSDLASKQNESCCPVQTTKSNECMEIMNGEEEQKRMENGKSPLTPQRHLPLQRQEATLFSKQWESSVSRGKSQSHESTDSGFSESSDQYQSPSNVMPNDSMDSFTDPNGECPQQTSSSHTTAEKGRSRQEAKDGVSKQEQKTLEERITKLISENSAVVEDKQLENVRPRKTVLSKQGSIDLPMPYTYKDSFHFDMKKASNVEPQRNRKPSLYNSVPTQCATEHTSLTRSTSLPFSVTLLQTERRSPTSAYQRDYVTLPQGGSLGQISSTDFAIKSVDQQVSTHRPLVRQAAVDCNHTTEGLFVNSSVEEACSSSLSCDGDRSDICGEPSNRKCRRRKAQKFAYNKWYMYGGGTFKKLYNAEKSCDNSGFKARKSLSKPEHDVFQGIQRKLTTAHSEAMTTMPSVMNPTRSSETVCHPSCLPANLPPVLGVDFNQKASQLHSSCTSFKTPVLRKLSLSTLQLSIAGSSDTHTQGGNRAEMERLINKEKHTDSISQLCGAHAPSDRKKQRTDTIARPVGEETDANTSFKPSPYFICSLPNKDTNHSYVNPQSNQEVIQLKDALLPPCIINANGASASTSSALSITAKTSFLPKYQLKLPNAAEADSNSSTNAVNQSPGTCDSPNFSSNISSSHTCQTLPSITTLKLSGKKCMETSIPTLGNANKDNLTKTNSFSFAQGQLAISPTTSTLQQSESSVTTLLQNAVPTQAAAYAQFTSVTTTTGSLHDHRAKLCTTSIQRSLSKPVVRQVLSETLQRSAVPILQNSSATPAKTTKENQSSAAACAISSQALHPPLSHTHPSPPSDQLNSVNTVAAGPNTSIVPCPMVSSDSALPAAQNVFHVHTAGLQICLQIISDEQLALIEPQIERQGHVTETSLSQGNNSEAVAPEVIPNNVYSIDMESTSEGKDHEKSGLQKGTDQREPWSTSNSENIKPLMPMLSQAAQPNTLITKQGDGGQAATSAESTSSDFSNMVTESVTTMGQVVSTASLLKIANSESGQNPEEKHTSTLRCSTEKRSISHGGPISEPQSGQHKLCLAGSASLSPTTVAKNCTGSELRHKESQHKLLNQRATCDGGEKKQLVTPHVSEEACGSLQPSQDQQRGRSSDRDSSEEWGPKEGVSPTGRAAQEEPVTRGQRGTRGQPDSPDWELKQSQDTKTDHQCLVGQEIRGVAGKDENGGMRSSEAEEVPEQWGKPESKGGRSCLSCMIKPEGEEKNEKLDCCKNSRLSVQQLYQHLSQTHFGMSAYPPQTPQQEPSTPNHPNSHTSFSTSQQHEIEMNTLFSQRHGEMGVSHNRQTQMLRESDAIMHTKQQPHLLHSQVQRSHLQSHQQIPNETMPHPNQQIKGQDHNDIGLSAQTLPPTETGTTANNISQSSCPKNSIGCPRGPSVSLAIKSSPSNQSNLQPPLNPGHDNKQESRDHIKHDQITHSFNLDSSNKGQLYFSVGQFYNCQTSECLTSGLRPVQSCQNYTDDTSSSDDEGKLIIEL